MGLTANRIFASILILFFSAISSAQTSLNYTATTNTTASLLLDKNGNAINLSSEPNLFDNNVYYGNSALTSIGFEVVFMGKRYSHFVAGPDGTIGLGLANSPAGILTAFGNNLPRVVDYPPANGTSPVLAPFWDDLQTAAAGSTVRSTIVGNAPKRCRVVQWNVRINASSGTATDPADGLFQARIYEGTGEIEYVYGKMQIGPGSGVVTASIGFTSGSTDYSFIGVKDLSTFSVSGLVSDGAAIMSLVNSAAPGAIAGLNSATEGSRRFISFRPVSCNGTFIGSGVSRVFATTMQLNWTDNITNKLGYLILRSAVDSNNYQYVASLPPSATSYVANNLNTNTRYFWKIIPYTEGNTNTVKVLTDSTRCSMKGVYKIGAGGDFSSIRSAQDSLTLWGMAGTITWELLPSFSFASENLPVVFKSQPPCYDKNFTITLRPTTGASLDFINNSTAPVFLIDSSENIIIDGRAGGVGSVALILEGPGDLIKIRNGRSNQVRFIEFRSSVASATLSPVSVEGTSGAGSYLNTISNCVLHDRGSSFSLPFQLVRSVIRGGPNYNNTVSACNFYNFKRFALDIDGKGWTINDNSFYNTVPVNATDTSGFINITTNDDSLQNQLTGNSFGGTAPNCSGDVMTWNVSWLFYGLGLNESCLVKNNQFKRIKISTSPTLTSLSTIDLIRVGRAGGTSIHFTIQQNKFGDLNPGDSISIINNSPGSLQSTIIKTVAGTGLVDSNTFVYIHTFVNGSNTYISLDLVEASSFRTTISRNVLSTVQQPYRIVHLGSQLMTALNVSGSAAITDNIITNIAARNKVAAIFAQFGSFIDPTLNPTITGNTISHIKSLECVSGPDNYSAAGIAIYRSAALIERNKILHIEDTSMLMSPVGAVSIYSKDCDNNISRNLIDGLLQNQALGYSKSMRAFSMEDDRSVIVNNMVRLGVDSAGTSIPVGSFLGYTNIPTTTNLVIHNTIYITGQGGYSPTENHGHCIFYEGASTFVNNILVNKRPDSTGNHNSIFNLSSGSQSSVIIDYNDYDHPDSGLFAYAYPSNLTFQQWVKPNRDAHSIVMAPNFVSPDAPTRTLDLHVKTPTPIDGMGTSFSTYTTTYDYDGDVRANNSPVDIGADAPSNLVTAIPDINGLEELKVIPNPNNGAFAIKIKLNTTKNVSFTLYNLLGQAVYQSQVYHLSGMQSRDISKNDLPDGIYFLETRIGKESVISKIVIGR